MKVKGQLNTCDRCGVMMFQEVMTEHEMDGGFTRWTDFVEPNDERDRWYLIHISGQRWWVCPECYREYQARLEAMEKEYVNAANRENRPLKEILRKKEEKRQKA